MSEHESSHSASAHPADVATVEGYWEDRYSSTDRIWSGRVNGVLKDVAASLAPGTALDLGCGEGGDVIWLAEQGWQVTGVDVSPTAVTRTLGAAAARGIVDRVEAHAADLATWTTAQRFDLVSASYLQSWPVEIPRAQILATAASFVKPGGHLLITSHVEAPSWSGSHHHGHHFPTVEQDYQAAVSGEGSAEWEVVIKEPRERQTVSPQGQPATIRDGVVLLRRVG